MSRRRDRPSFRTLAVVSLWGVGTATVAYLVSGGSVLRMIAAFAVIGIGQRLWAANVWRRRGRTLPKWWWLR